MWGLLDLLYSAISRNTASGFQLLYRAEGRILDGVEDSLLMASLDILVRSVLGLRPSDSAAPFGPLILQFVSSSRWMMISRSNSSKLFSLAGDEPFDGKSSLSIS